MPCGAPMRRVASVRDAANIAALAIAIPWLHGCAQLHLTQDPHQVLQRTANEDDYNARQPAGPTAARILPYALLAEQSYEPSVYALHRMAPRATGCIADDPAGCDLLKDSKRVAAWLHQWRYVWSCDGPERCKVQTPGESEPVGGLGVQVWARKGVRCPEAVVAFRGTVGGNEGTGSPTFTGFSARFPSTTNTIRSGTTSATSSAISSGTSATGQVRLDHGDRALARRRARPACGLFRSAHPARLRLRSLDGDRLLFRRSGQPRPDREGPAHGARLRARRDPGLWPVRHRGSSSRRLPAIPASSASASMLFTAARSPSTA